MRKGILMSLIFVLFTASLMAASKNTVEIKVSGSPTCITNKGKNVLMYFDSDYGVSYGLTIQDLRTNKKCISALILQENTKEGQVIKAYAGVPFRLEELISDNIELQRPIQINIQNAPFEWQDKSVFIPKENDFIHGEPGIPKLSGNFLLAYGTSVFADGTMRISVGSNIKVIEIDLKNPEIISQLQQEDMIIPVADSLVPFECDPLGIPQRPVPNAIGVTWYFGEPGMTFVVGSDLYESKKVGATIEFTKGGVILNGIQKKQP